MLNIDLETTGGAILARLSGELDRSAREPLLKAVRTEAEASGGKVVLDCANLSALDSEGVRALLALQTWLRIKDSEMAIAALPARLEETIKSDPGVDQFLTRHPSVDEALQGLGLPPQGGAGSGAAPPAAAFPPSSSTPPPARPATPPPVSAGPPATPPPAAASPPAADVGGWGSPPAAVPESSPPTPSDPPASRPASDPPAGEARGGGAWETPIATPEPVAGGGAKPEPKPEEPAISAPAGAWGAPVAEPESPAQPAAANKEPTAWAKGPPPRDEKPPGKKSKKGIIIGALVGLIVVGVIASFFIKPTKALPPTIGPEISHDLVGKVGEVPTPKEVVFRLTNVDLVQDITTIPGEDALEKWIEMEVSGTNENCQVTFTFSTVDAIPEHQSIILEAQGLDKTPVNGFINFAIQEPNAKLVILDEPLKEGEVGNVYSDWIALNDRSQGVFRLDDGSQVPKGLNLLESGKLTGTPEEAGSFEFTVRATRGEDEPASKVFTLTIAEPPTEEEESVDAMKLLQDIKKRVGNIDMRHLRDEALNEYQRFAGYLFHLNEKNAVEYVKPVVTVTFALGKVDVEKAEVESQLNAMDLDDWVTNQDVRFVVAGFADKIGGDEANRVIIRERAKSLKAVVEDWLIKEWNISPALARKRVVVIPNKPSDDFETARAAECWLFKPPNP